jgi:cellulose synthase/poly-beta-1,6-N-acetylglucosamine synthase-like glycosyltransferase
LGILKAWAACSAISVSSWGIIFVAVSNLCGVHLNYSVNNGQAAERMINSILLTIWIAFQILIGYNLIVPFAMYVFYALKRKKVQPRRISSIQYDYAIIVTAFEQADALPAVVNSILRLNYRNYMVYVVADKCDVSRLQFEDERIVLLRPPETLASNTGSHFYAIRHFVRAHDLLVIVDSDNLVDPSLLLELNKCFDDGFSAVQGVRKAKNLDTTYACLDAARDIYYHFYDGKVLFEVGSSATLAGSGMAFKTQLYRECLETLDIKGAGFDKVLQHEIVKRGYRIAFTEAAIVYDEKTANSQQLVKQRARWINTWFRYCGFGFSLAAAGIRSSDHNKFLFGVVLLRPPLFIFLLLSFGLLMVNSLISPTGLALWTVGFCLFIAGFFIAFSHSNPDKRITRSLVNIPRFMFYQVISLLLAKKANKISVATQHYNHTGINEVERQTT